MAHWLSQRCVLEWKICLCAGENRFDQALRLNVAKWRGLAEHTNQYIASVRDIICPSSRPVPSCYPQNSGMHRERPNYYWTA